MRLTVVILIASLMQVSAIGVAQKITLNQRNVSLNSVLKEIRKQSGFDIYYDSKDISKDQKVSVAFKDADINEALVSTFKGLDLTYEIEGKTIAIKKKKATVLDNLIAGFQAIDVRGRVVDADGNPLVGASVTVKGGKGTTTDKDGGFYLAKVDEKVVLIISFIGYLTKEVNAAKDLGTIQLDISNSKLDEVIVQAYGTTSRRFTTSNISSIKAEDIAKQPVQNLLLALQGRVPGVFIEQQSGMSNANIEVILQGRNSIFNGNTPFFVIDGVPYTPKNIASPVMGGIFPGSGGSTLSFINPADIESVEFLKDADATAIYGSRAANGAILITTKRGKAGETKVDLNVQNGWGKVGRRLNLLNTEDYVALRSEAYKNAGRTPSLTEFDMSGIWDQTRTTDWQKELLGGSSHYQNYSTNVSGGSDGTQFLIGAAYNRETPIYVGEFSNVKTNVHFNINHASKNKKFQISLTGNYLQGNNNIANLDLNSIAVDLPPNAPKLYNDDGTINFDPLIDYPGYYSFNNPLASLEQRYTDNTNNLISSAQVSYEIINGLKLKADVGYNRLSTDETSIVPSTYYTPDARPYIDRTASYSNKYIESWIIEPQLTYTRDFSFGHIDALLGTSFQQSENNLAAYSGSGYSTDAQLLNPKSAAYISSLASSQINYKYGAAFGRLNYRYKEKYILNLTARRDGSSKFGSANLFNNFYSAGAAWLFSEEEGLKNILPFISFGKLRVTYGSTGNDQIPDYGFLNLYDNYGVEIAYQNLVGLLPSGLQNKYLQWEETRKLNLGIDLGFINNRISLNLNYFRNRSSNQLLSYALPFITGFNGVSQNFPATVQNSGLEILVDASPIKTNKFTWQVSANLTVPRNKLVEFRNLDESSYANAFIIGEPVNIIQAYSYAGVNSETGLYQFNTAKGELTSTPDPLTDRTVLINTNPKWYAGFSNTFNYKGFDLSFLFQAVKQIGSYDRFGNLPGIGPHNQPTIVKNRWHEAGDESALVQRVSTRYSEAGETWGFARQSDAMFTDAFYIRLKNASLSYSFPKEWLSAIHVSNARVFFNGQNLFTISKFGPDPESRISAVLPPLRVYSFGFQLTF